MRREIRDKGTKFCMREQVMSEDANKDWNMRDLKERPVIKGRN